MATAPPLTAAQLVEARRLKLTGLSVRDIAARLGRGKTQIAAALASDPTLGPRREAAPTLEQIERRTARVAASAGANAAAVATGDGSPRTEAPTPPPALEEGQAPTELDHDLRVAYLAEVQASEHWQGATTIRILMELWKVPLRDVQAYAAKARRLLWDDLGLASRKRMTVIQVAALVRLAEKAETAGNLAVAGRLRLGILATSAKAAAPLLAGRSLSAEGLPPELARLKNPAASPAEVALVASVGADECTCTGCRVHPRAEGAAAPVPPATVVVVPANSTPMH